MRSLPLGEARSVSVVANVALCIAEEDGVLAAVACAQHGCAGRGLVVVLGSSPVRQRVVVSDPDPAALIRWFEEPDSALRSWSDAN